MSDEMKGNDYEDVEDNVSVVGMQKSKKIAIVLVVLVATGLIYYSFFREGKNPSSGGPDEPKKVVEQEVERLLKSSELPAQETSPVVSLPQRKLPALPPLVVPDIAEVPVVQKTQEKSQPEEEILPPPLISNKKTEVSPVENMNILPLPYSAPATNPVGSFLGYDKERRNSQMLVIGGSAEGGEGGDGQHENKDGGQTVDKRFDGDNTISGTASASVRATKVGNLNYIVLQGKMIDAVLETAINSDLPGVLRAIVSRDVYAEASDAVMIPRGSRLIGNYTFDASGKNTRVSVTWSRVILPHGIDVQINSSGTDELGRHGLSGVVDNKVANILTSTILLAGVSLSTAFATSKIPALKDAMITAKKNDDGSASTVSTSLPAKIATDAISDFSESVKGILQKYADTNPTIYVDQGTLMKVFVNQDLVFPKSAVLKVWK